MRVDGGSTYHFPSSLTISESNKCLILEEEGCEESLLTAFPVKHGGGGGESEGESEGDWTDDDGGITLELAALPLLTDEGDHTPVGAQAWYASAVLSAMLLLVASDLDHQAEDSSSSPSSSDTTNNTLLHDDLRRIMASNQPRTSEEGDESSSYTVLELGSGAVGLSGMAMAWILAQQYHLQNCRRGKVILTDHNPDCLDQLRINAESVQERFKEFYSPSVRNEEGAAALSHLQVQHLDWQQYDESQAVLDVENKGTIELVLGAALVYMPENACCSSQIAKVLSENPQAVVWIVQYPRDGWLQILQLDLQRRLPGVEIRKLIPSTIHPRVHSLAQTLLPRQLGDRFDEQFIKAIRISLALDT